MTKLQLPIPELFGAAGRLWQGCARCMKFGRLRLSIVDDDRAVLVWDDGTGTKMAQMTQWVLHRSSLLDDPDLEAERINHQFRVRFHGAFTLLGGRQWVRKGEVQPINPLM